MKNLEKFVETLKENLGDNLIMVLAFGSMANVEEAKNNLNLMVVTKELTAENLYSISKPVQKWVKAKNPVPVIMNKEELIKIRYEKQKTELFSVPLSVYNYI